ncbi:MAG TPA: phosphatidylserine decarboxylase family protein [Saprospiraceae bacterium]|nr:phosphatidylserine decarboxylase family protein [Saprospiraceae bacterium]
MMYRLHKEGIPYLISATFFFLVSLIFIWLHPSIITILVFGLALFFLIMFLIFFRNPPRINVSNDKNSILSPADGKVVVIEKTMENEFLKSEAIQVSVFMSPLNVHINRSPIEGDLIYQQYHPGLYLVAWHPKSSELNERNTLVFKNGNKQVLIRQIAGKVARKIVSYAKVGTAFKAGEEFGFIKFGSRVDLFLPTDAIIKVKIGDVVQGGVTEIGLLPPTP